MNYEKILSDLQEWVDNYPSWLSEKTDYARGYKAGIIQAQQIVKEIISKHNNKMTHLTTTPLLKQYAEMKKKHPDAILLFRVGDFYEIFSDDAKDAADILGITLTQRSNGKSKIYLAGFPHHALDTYLSKLVRAGHRVAICEPLEDPRLTKKLVKRGVADESVSE